MNRFGFAKLAVLLAGISLGAISTNGLPLQPNSSNPLGADRPLSALRLMQNRNSPNAAAYQDVARATVCVRIDLAGEAACASGVSIDPQLAGMDSTQGAVVLTNYHVIADVGHRPSLQLGGKGEVYDSEIIRQSPEFDLALLLVPGVEFPVAGLAEASPTQGTTVRAIGFPNNQPALMIKNSRLLGETQTCLAVAPCLALQQGTITFGNSGGPLEANGKVIGITQGEFVDEIAIPVEQIRQFLAGAVPPPSHRPNFEPGPPMGAPPPDFPYSPDFPHPLDEPDYPYPVW